MIRSTDQKTGKKYVVLTHRCLQGYLRTLTGSSDPHEYPCPTIAKKATGDCSGRSEQFQKLMRQAGVDTRESEKSVLLKVEGKTAQTLARRSFHGLRHTYNTRFANVDVSHEFCRKLVGHSSDEVNDIYTHLDVALFREAINRLA